MIAQAAAVMRHTRALHLPPFIGLARSFRWPAITLGALGYRNAIGAAAGAFACAATTLAIMIYQESRQDTAAIVRVLNETIVFRQEERIYRQSEQVEASNVPEDADAVVPSNYPRVVRTVRFVNSDAARNIGINRERVSNAKPYTINGRRYVPTDNPAYRGEGVASWYGPDFHGRLTANGERYDMHGISAAHRTMPLPSYARVTNLDNGRSIIVRVNNRGPFAHNRIADLSVGTAKALDFYKKGTAHVRVEYVGPAPVQGNDDQMLLATLRAGAPAAAPAEMMVASAKPFLPKDNDGKELRSPTER